MCAVFTFKSNKIKIKTPRTSTGLQFKRKFSQMYETGHTFAKVIFMNYSKRWLSSQTQHTFVKDLKNQRAKIS
jgi:hypothetical protein